MMSQSQLAPVQLSSNTKSQAPLGMGCSFYGLSDWNGAEANAILGALSTALDNNITHFDTAQGYGDGESERLIGRFLAEDSSRRERIFLASKVNSDETTSQAMLAAVDESLAALQTDVIDLYYIHWPRTGQDLRPMMEGLETARQQGKIHAIGVSNFSIEQMAQIAEVGKIDVHQLGYNLLWRFPERDIIPYCVENGISVVVYSALAHGILAGKYQQQLSFAPDDQRWGILLFREDIYPRIYENVERFKAIAAASEVSLIHLALRWLLHQSGVTSVLASAKNQEQAHSNIMSLQAEVDESVFEELTSISDEVMQYIPDEGNPFGYHP